MKLLAAITCLLSCSGAFGETFYRCFWIASPQVDCVRFSPDPTCGTNLVTYANKCEFSKAHCNDTTIDLRHSGACTSVDGSTPTPIAGGDVVFNFLCTSLSHKDCPIDGDRVCGSDGRAYDNVCEYEKAKCTHRELHALDCTV